MQLLAFDNKHATHIAFKPAHLQLEAVQAEVHRFLQRKAPQLQASKTEENCLGVKRGLSLILATRADGDCIFVLYLGQII